VECQGTDGKPFKRVYQITDDVHWGYLDTQPDNTIVNFQANITDFSYHPKTIMLDWVFSYGYYTPNNLITEYKSGDWISEWYPELLEEHKMKEKAAYFVIHDKGGVNILAVVWNIWQI